MRQGQHKNRSRGRNQRRQGNPSNRVYESNGPDVKVRGTAQTVADKYLQLARDAVSSGDIVMSESYYQHAEHYIRIIAANQSQQQQQQQLRAQEAAANAEAAAEEGEAPGTGPQPTEEATAKPARDGGNGDASKSNGSGAATDSDSKASFDGELPQFLKAPVDEPATEEKPKRGRRKKVVEAEAAAEEDTDTSAKDASGDDADGAGSDAEVAVG